MRRALPFAVAMLFAGAAHAELPVFAAKCPTNINVDSDTKGGVYINGKRFKAKKVNENYYEAKSAKVTISIATEPSGPPIISYTGKGRGNNGVCEVLSYKEPESSPAASGPSSSERAGQGQFDANGQIPCAQFVGQPMMQCPFGVARDGGGSATVVVSFPDGRKRFIFFEKGKAISADLSQADGNMEFHVTKEADLYIIRAGDGRFEIPEAVVFGG